MVVREFCDDVLPVAKSEDPMKRFALGLAFCLTSSASAEWSQFNVVVRDYSLPTYEVNAPSNGIYAYNEPVWEPTMPADAPAKLAGITHHQCPVGLDRDVRL